jgi:hypothetical protein
VSYAAHAHILVDQRSILRAAQPGLPEALPQLFPRAFVGFSGPNKKDAETSGTP